MPTPTMSVRALPEHHQLLRRMARALMERPELAESLTALIEGVPQAVSQDVMRPDTTVDQRFEDIERRLEQIESQGVLRGDTPDVLREIQGVVQAVQERQALQEKTTLKIMDMVESISDRVKDLEQIATQQHTAPQAVTRLPRLTSVGQGGGRGAGGGAKRLTDEQDHQIVKMLNAGRSYSEIGAAVGVSSGALTRIKARLEREGRLLTAGQPARHPDENPEPPVEPSTE
jgi:DNA-binding Lrp family transcriptional regulator